MKCHHEFKILYIDEAGKYLKNVKFKRTFLEVKGKCTKCKKEMDITKEYFIGIDRAKNEKK